MSAKQENGPMTINQKLIQNSRDEISRRVVHEYNKYRLNRLLLERRLEEYRGFDRRQKPRGEGV